MFLCIWVELHHIIRVLTWINAGCWLFFSKISWKPESEFMRITLLNDYVDIVIPKNSFFFWPFLYTTRILSIYAYIRTYMWYKNKRHTHTDALTQHINNFPVDKTNLEIQQHLAEICHHLMYKACIQIHIKSQRCGNSQQTDAQHKMIASIYIRKKEITKNCSDNMPCQRTNTRSKPYLSVNRTFEH